MLVTMPHSPNRKNQNHNNLEERIYIPNVQGIDRINNQIFNSSIITEEVELIDDTVEVEEIVDAREVHEDIIEAMVEGT